MAQVDKVIFLPMIFSFLIIFLFFYFFIFSRLLPFFYVSILTRSNFYKFLKSLNIKLFLISYLFLIIIVNSRFFFSYIFIFLQKFLLK